MANFVGTPKNLRIQTLQKSVTDSPLRRRSGIHTPVAAKTTITINDDEAERTRNRIREDQSLNESTSAALDTDQLQLYLKLHSENKIGKDNAWTVLIIESFTKLIRKHHTSLDSFQVAGSSLEASSKVYSFRVDSVYQEVIRITSDLTRQNSKALKKKLAHDEDDDSAENQENDSSMVNEGRDKEEPAKKKQKRRKNVSTIAKSKESLNAKLDTVPFTDPFFAKLNSIVGDINSAKRLMQNIIPTQNSILKLRQNNRFWDDSPAADLDLEKFDIEEFNINQFSDQLEIGTTPISRLLKFGPNTHLQNGLRGYILSDQPLENEEEETLGGHDSFCNQSVAHQSLNSSHIDMRFDLNASVEPINHDQEQFVMDYGDMDHNDLLEMDQDEQNALNRCKMLKRKATIIESEQPNECVSLEYSYRPLEVVGQFWAGPSHWKFRRTTKSLGNRLSHFKDSTANTEKVVQKKKRTKKTNCPLELEDVLNQKSTLVRDTKKLKNITLTRQTLSKKWDCRKLKLPKDYKIDMDIFDKFVHAPNLQPQKSDATFTPDENPDYNYDNDVDRNYCIRGNGDETDTETETDLGQVDNIGEMDMGENVDFADNAKDPNADLTVDYIPDEYVGAPDKIEKFNIMFAKRAKPVNMKQLKLSCLQLISETKTTVQPEEVGLRSSEVNGELKSIHFQELIHELPKVLSKTMGENLSVPLAFYSVLHLTNEHSYKLLQDAKLKDFDIITKTQSI